MDTSRQFLCGRCRRQVVVCRRCDRGQRYCDRGCSLASRKIQLRAAGARHQHSVEGRRDHADRQRAYRERQQQKNKKVTHQGSGSTVISPKAWWCPKKNSGAQETRDVIVESQHLFGSRTPAGFGDGRFGRRSLQNTLANGLPPSAQPNNANGSAGLLEWRAAPCCDFCGQRCNPFVRVGFLRKAMARGKRIGALQVARCAALPPSHQRRR